MAIIVTIDAAPFDPNKLTQTLAPGGDDGALASFTGLCRDDGGTLAALELEHYPAMAQKQLEAIAHKAADRFPVSGLVVHHRYGVIKPGEAIVLVAATSRHRDAAFDAVRFVMDFLKTDAPFWKKQHLKGGDSAGWIDARATDDMAKQRWAKP